MRAVFDVFIRSTCVCWPPRELDRVSY